VGRREVPEAQRGQRWMEVEQQCWRRWPVLMNLLPLQRCDHQEQNTLKPKIHHFRSHVDQKLIQIAKVSTEEQLADIFTKQCSLKLFQAFRESILGWNTISTDS
jgi:hypothetical protein